MARATRVFGWMFVRHLARTEMTEQEVWTLGRRWISVEAQGVSCCYCRTLSIQERMFIVIQIQLVESQGGLSMQPSIRFSFSALVC